MFRSLIILGRQPALGIAELECLYGAKLLQPYGREAVLVDQTPDHIKLSRLGGSIKVCKVLGELPSAHWNDIEKYLLKELPKLLADLPSGEGKLTFGISAYGASLSPQRVGSTALLLKKRIRNTGRSVRVVPNKTAVLNSAQILHNKLTTVGSWELVLVIHNQRTVLAQTTEIQDIEAYAARDQARPMRDARVGMLPPKLAQIIVNLAVGQSITYDKVVLDPFCGTGVLLQEALLMGFKAYGTDIEQRMIDYSAANLKWLGIDQNRYTLEQADATNHPWQPIPDTVATETYLGRAFSTEPSNTTLQEVMHDVDTIHRKFLKHLALQLPKGTRLCLAVPAWRIKNSFYHLSTIDSLEQIGYTRHSFVHAKISDLVYYRSDQIVGRELLVLTRK